MKGEIKIPQAGVNTSFELEVSEVGEFITTITPDFVKELGGILSDTVRNWRFRNEIGILLRAKKLVVASGLRTETIPLKVLVPLIEASSLEEDGDMKERWARLLANGLTGKIEIKPSYVEILKELSPIEAVVLDKIFNEIIQESDPQKRNRRQFSKEKISTWLGMSKEQADLLVENLFRLNLCRMPGSMGMSFGENMPVAVSTTEIFEFTSTGFDFVKACREIE